MVLLLKQDNIHSYTRNVGGVARERQQQWVERTCDHVPSREMPESLLLNRKIGLRIRTSPINRTRNLNLNSEESDRRRRMFVSPSYERTTEIRLGVGFSPKYHIRGVQSTQSVHADCYLHNFGGDIQVIRNVLLGSWPIKDRKQDHGCEYQKSTILLFELKFYYAFLIIVIYMLTCVASHVALIYTIGNTQISPC